ncbi:RNA polymerase sigma factor [Sphingobacterium corticibacter]|uniref:Sigma-70 family RNA polymerase sigma factor n=1 Tax=Sphingobacterium corticibacter TaxID=2171749 RepID=A0A2T8HHF7_9SPHI|nr:sigma-70 family RNA polymerase sigma factor [Sphingobacterium corticibacter]PVH24833.1 hypothetical protein DC487_11985 [Sphingobacterium corticibacter]
MSVKQAIDLSQQYVRFLNNGEERALGYFYNYFYSDLFKKAQLSIGDIDISRTFVQEAFFRLWLFRKHVSSLENVEILLFEEIKRATKEYYGNPSEQFRRNFVPLQTFHAESNCFWIADLDDKQYSQKQDPEDRIYIRKINALMPNLRQDQQTLIRLCLEYSFNYERIADHLGGRSSQEVRFKAEQAIAHMRSVFKNTEKLQALEANLMQQQVTNLDSDEALVLDLRFNQQQTFTEIANALEVDVAVAQSLFVRAYRKTKLSHSQDQCLTEW